MKTMLKISAVLFAAFALASCNVDNADEGIENLGAATKSVNASALTINAENVVGLPAGTDEVRAMLYVNGGYREFASAKVNNGGFSIKLSGSLEAKYLSTTLSRSILDQVEATDDEVKLCELDFFAFSEGQPIGTIRYNGTVSGMYYNVQYTFADRVSFVEGAFSTTTIDMSIAKGWNTVVYGKSDSERAAYTSVPQGMQWSYDSEHILY